MTLCLFLGSSAVVVVGESRYVTLTSSREGLEEKQTDLKGLQ